MTEVKKRYDVLVPSQGKDGKNYYTKIGVGFLEDSGNISILTPVYANMVLIPHKDKEAVQHGNGE